MMHHKNVIDWVKLSPKYLIPFSLVSGLLIFANEKLLNTFGLSLLVNNIRPWIAIFFLISTALIASNFIVWLGGIITKKISQTRNLNLRIKKLHKLSPDEKKILLSYLLQNTRTQTFPFNDGRLAELIHYRIIFQSSNIGDINDWPYNIQPWAWDYLQKHQDELFTESECKECLEYLSK